MPQIRFEDMPDDARLWVFTADRALAPPDRETLLAVTDDFLETWAAHGAPLTCARELKHDRFLFVAVDERAAGVSGCSIDALVHSLKQLEQELDMLLLDHAPVSFRQNGDIKRVSRSEFSDLVGQGSVSLETPVFNNTIGSVGQLRRGEWEVAASESWHKQAFF